MDTQFINHYIKSEFAHPYTILSPHLDIIIASPQGGEAPLDPASVTAAETADDQVARKFLDENRELWTRTVPLHEVLKDVEGGDFEGVFYVGGHGRVYPSYTEIYVDGC